ncbi:hypothetical protein C345_05148, partial [Cryptococcus neoformans A2-102-5]
LLLSIATPQHPTHHTQLVHSHSATPPRWLNYATDEREDMQDRWENMQQERVGYGDGIRVTA